MSVTEDWRAERGSERDEEYERWLAEQEADDAERWRRLDKDGVAA